MFSIQCGLPPAHDSPRLKPGASRFMAVACSPAAPRRLRPSPKNLVLAYQRSLQDVLRRIAITIMPDPTVRALPGSVRQC